MCGIAAIFSLKGKKDLSPIVPMTKIVQHRGPDGEGIVFFNEGGPHVQETLPSHLALGHRRLAILDLSASGIQPMESMGLWVTYNGEIYNYLELKKELVEQGVQFKTETDTEVLLKAYQTYGIGFLDKLNGMFAFVLHDRNKQKAYAVRDRFGVKPLYLHEIDGCLAFASEIKQFQAFKSFKARLNHQRAYDFLNYGIFDHTEETLFQGVQQLKGGQLAEINLQDGSFQIKRWYHLPKTKSAMTYEEAVKNCRTLLKDAVEIRLRSDVEVGSCLSGGIDSSSIVCLSSKALKTFSARSEDPRLDEFPFMERVNAHTGSESFTITPRAQDLMQSFDALLWHQDEPFASTSVLAQWALFSKVKEQGIKVMLDGQGADEQLGGYFEFYGIFLKQLVRERRLGALVREIRRASKNQTALRPFRQLIKQFIPPAIKNRLLYRMNKPSSKCPWLDFKVLRCTESAPFNKGHTKSFKSYAEEMLLHSNLPMLLHYEDRNSMAHSVESRTPFLDYRLVEFIHSLPAHFFLREGLTKALLRDAMQGIVPDEVLQRRDKIAFATSEQQWLNRDVFLDAIKEAARVTQVFKPVIIAKTEAVLAGKEPFSFLPFRVIAFGKWFKLNNVTL